MSVITSICAPTTFQPHTHTHTHTHTHHNHTQLSHTHLNTHTVHVDVNSRGIGSLSLTDLTSQEAAAVTPSAPPLSWISGSVPPSAKSESDSDSEELPEGWEERLVGGFLK